MCVFLTFVVTLSHFIESKIVQYFQLNHTDWEWNHSSYNFPNCGEKVSSLEVEIWNFVSIGDSVKYKRSIIRIRLEINNWSAPWGIGKKTRVQGSNGIQYLFRRAFVKHNFYILLGQSPGVKIVAIFSGFFWKDNSNLKKRFCINNPSLRIYC